MGRRGVQVRNVVWVGMLSANLGNTGVGGLASLGEGIVARVEVFALLCRGGCQRLGARRGISDRYLKLVLEEILLVR